MSSRFVSSEQNPDIKRIKALRDRRSVRHAERLCIVEGPRFVEDAARTQRPSLLVVSDIRGDADLPPADDVVVVPDQLFARISDTATPQGMLAIFPFPDLPARTSSNPLFLIADGVQDPGNLGTMIRSAAALGATGVICTPGTADPFAPKVIRSAAAAQWLVPIELSENLDALPSGTLLYAADGMAGTTVDQVDLTGPSAIAVGSEGHGLSDAVLRMPHISVAVPIASSVESLNAGIAAGIFLYEAQRQRRRASG